jgi:hypothetical protein
MEVDLKYALERFQGMTREELLEEAALQADGYVPLVRRLLEGEVLARGIAPDEIAARREAAAPARQAEIDFPALITSAIGREQVQGLVETLRAQGIPAVVREIDTRVFHGSACVIGRWGLFVPGEHAAAAGRALEALLAGAGMAAGASSGCGACGGSCGDGESAALEPGEWDEDGDWWKTGAPGEEDQ